MAGTCTAGLNPQDPHCIPGYTGHCPLLRFSMGQTYGQVTARLLRGPPGLAWPPAHRTLLPPIRPPGPPGLSRRSLPARCRHRRLRSSVTPGYTADQGSQELAKETTGDKDGEPESERGPVIAKVSPYSMDDTDPQKFFMSAPASLCSPTRHCGNLGRSARRAVPSKVPDLCPHLPGPTRRTWAFCLTMGATCQVISSCSATHLGTSPMMLWA
ncbi:PREDICTED: protein FAM166B isoform X4 [Chinchilla lanigera]|uniref:protein FAM166B isoform X4 n=1 Tax=Chinchilla lanigera TaxID=34839 RepID=UPI0006975932|nr:PREDICTED: protein FAM166B isoform X4 [Chinchilla lanigera]